MVKCPAFKDGLCRSIEGGPKELELEKGEVCDYYRKVKDKDGKEVSYCSYNQEMRIE